MKALIPILMIALVTSGLSIVALPLVQAGFGPDCCNPIDKPIENKSILTVPEPSTIAVTAAPFVALGLAYTIRRKKQ